MTGFIFEERRVFCLSLATSVLLHGLVLVSFFYKNIHTQKKTLPKQMETVYQFHAKQKANKKPYKYKIQKIRKAPKSLPTKTPKMMTKEKTLDPLPLLKQVSKQMLSLDRPTKPQAQLPTSGVKRHVSIPVLTSENISNLKYFEYLKNIRNKIKNRINAYIDDPEFQKGEVYLTFVLASNGDLKRIKIVDAKTKANSYLRGVGLRSIKESAPFSSFPTDLKYPELSFSIGISFGMEE